MEDIKNIVSVDSIQKSDFLKKTTAKEATDIVRKAILDNLESGTKDSFEETINQQINNFFRKV